ncbi:hypothetical protein Tther_02253 [Tepidimonas thermarum]|uniref:Uncharacterized protein n=1 Tax=Tepidimonas thermarum TaxID=335431 RepID=A0A554WXA3_9BURK|nr:hypothetical protein Tther_02253 [Tepidimonas thermarum]
MVGRAIGGDDDDALGSLLARQVAQQLQPAAIGQPHVGQQRAVAPLRQARARLRQVPDGIHRQPDLDQRQLVELPQVGLVLDDEQGSGVVAAVHGAMSMTGIRMTKALPRRPSRSVRSWLRSA